MSYNPTPRPARADDDLIAAALAAVQLYLEAEQTDMAEDASRRTAWQAAALAAAQGVSPVRGAAASNWRTIERAGRAARWSAGMLGTFD